MKKIVLLIAFVLGAMSGWAQTSIDEIRRTPEKAGGVYYAYPVASSLNTPPPAGYEPFYVSHYGRHGSRYLISDNDYSRILRRLHHADSAGALTPLGRDVMLRLDTVWTEAEGRGGELTPLGRRQHHDIATRMYQAFPEVFADSAEVSAASTVVMRCAHSMFAFIEGLKEQNPRLEIPRESGQRNMWYLNYHSPESGPYASDKGEWFKDYIPFRDAKTQPDRLMKSLFSDSAYVEANIEAANLMTDLYWLAVDMQNMETPISFLDLFTAEELYDLWQIYNFSFFACNSSYPGAKGLHTANARNLVGHIVDNADRYIAEGKHGATLRFGHDGNIIPLTALLRLPGCYSNVSDPNLLASDYANFKISPMASNLQIVFFRNTDGDVIAKVMLNERETLVDLPTDNAPFYSWPRLRAYLKGL